MAQITTNFKSFVGVDLHKCTVSLAAVDPNGQLIGRLKSDTKCINKIDAWLRDLPRPCHMAVEAVTFAEWFIDRFRACVDKIDIAHATELARLRGKRRKTDRNDAFDVAKRLARGECPLGWIADEPVMQLRKLGRHWRQLSRLLSRSKHSLKTMLNAANIRGPKFDGASAQRWLLAHGHLLKDAQHDAFADFVDIIQLVERQRESLRRRIILANRSERFDAAMAIIQSVPGIKDIWGCIIAAEVGSFDRFPNADTIEFWAGLTPDNTESAGRTQSGNITKAGSTTLRWALGKAALCMCRSDAKQEAIRQRLIARRGKPKANVAMARRLLRILYTMMRSGSLYEIGQPTHHNRNANKARMKKRQRHCKQTSTTRKEAA